MHRAAVYFHSQLRRAVLDDGLRVHHGRHQDAGTPLWTEQRPVRLGVVQQRHHARVGGHVRRIFRPPRQQAAPHLRHDVAGGRRQPAHVSAALAVQLGRTVVVYAADLQR